MSEDKLRLPKLEMPKLSREALDAWSASMAEVGKAFQEVGDALRAAYPSIQERAGSMAQAVQPLMRKTDKP